MAKPAHSNNQHLQFNIDMNPIFYDQITWELPCCTQPWPETIPGFNLYPPEMNFNMQVA